MPLRVIVRSRKTSRYTPSRPRREGRRPIMPSQIAPSLNPRLRDQRRIVRRRRNPGRKNSQAGLRRNPGLRHSRAASSHRNPAVRRRNPIPHRSPATRRQRRTMLRRGKIVPRPRSTQRRLKSRRKKRETSVRRSEVNGRTRQLRESGGPIAACPVRKGVPHPPWSPQTGLRLWGGS